MESVILTSPFILICYCVALTLSLIELKTHATGYVFPILSAAIFVATTTYALLTGTPMQEVGVVALIFLALHLGAYRVDGGDNK